MRVVCSVVALLALAALTSAAVMKHSFKSPFYLVRGNSIPFWRFTGNALVTEEYVRLTSDQKSQKGSIWNTLPVSLTSWEITLEFSINGARQGADGLAFWYVQDPEREGPVYGSADKWHGLGVFIDTFDNNGRGAGPSVLAILNDGTKEYDHASDGESLAAGRCTAALRNQPKHSQLRITYDGNQLKVDLDVGQGGWRPCFAAAMSLPQGYYFGVSAATGGLADAHDLFVLSTLDLHRGPPVQSAPPPPPQPQQPEPTPVMPGLAAAAAQQQQFQQFQQQQQQQQPSYVTAAPPPLPSAPSLPPVPPPYVPPIVSPQQQQQQQQPQYDSAQLNMIASAVSSLTQQLGELRREVQELRTAIAAVPAETARAADSAAERHSNAAAERYSSLVNTHIGPVKASVQETQNKLRVCDDLRMLVEDAKINVRAVKTQTETLMNEQRNLGATMKSSTEQVLSAVSSSSSVGFWTYAIFLQFVFGVGFVWWRRTKDSHKYL